MDGYITNVFKYELFTKNYTTVSDTSTLDSYNINDYDYVVTMDNDKYVNIFMKNIENYNEKMVVTK